MEFPWRCNVDTIAMDLKVSWEMSVIACSIRRYAVCFVHDNEVSLGHGIRQYLHCPQIGREQNIIILESRSRVGNRQLADNVFLTKSFFELFQ